MAKKTPQKTPKDTTNNTHARYDDAIKAINKEFGEGSLSVGASAIVNCETFPSGIYPLDLALGCGGIPRGRVLEIFGSESSGKTTVCLKAIASCQRSIIDGSKGVAAFIDAEHALDPAWAAANGVIWEEMLFAQPNSGEEALKQVEILISAGLPLIVVDSVAALVPQKEIDGEIGDAHVGAQGRMMSQALRKLAGKCKKANTTVIFINQIREKVGISFGSPETTPGGRALKFYSSLRLRVESSSTLKDGDTIIGRKTRIRVIKNKVAPPFKVAEFDIYFGEKTQEPYIMIGADERSSLLFGASLAGVIKVRGSHYYFGEVALGNGRKLALQALNDKEMFNNIRNEFLQVIQPSNATKDTENNEETE